MCGGSGCHTISRIRAEVKSIYNLLYVFSYFNAELLQQVKEEQPGQSLHKGVRDLGKNRPSTGDSAVGLPSPAKRSRQLPSRLEPLLPPWPLKDKLDALLTELPPDSAVIAYNMVLGRVLRQKCKELRKDLTMEEVRAILPLPQVCEARTLQWRNS